MGVDLAGKFAAGFALRRAHVDEKSGADAGDCAIAGDWNRREHRDFQRDERAAAETVALSTCGPAGAAVAALAGNRDTAGLAFARAIPRRQNAESRVRRHGDCDRWKLHADRTDQGDEGG